MRRHEGQTLCKCVKLGQITKDKKRSEICFSALAPGQQLVATPNFGQVIKLVSVSESTEKSERMMTGWRYAHLEGIEFAPSRLCCTYNPERS